MTILTRYVSKEFLKLFSLCLLILLVIYLTVDLIQKIDDFIEAGATKSAMAGYFLCKIPYIIVQMVPVGTLLSVIILFSLMKKNNEITALKASGVSIFRISLPVFWVSLGLSGFVFLFSEFIVPQASTRSQEIWNHDVKKRDRERLYGRGHIWYKARNAIYWIERFNEADNMMEGPVFYFFDDSFRLKKRIEGKSATWHQGRWIVRHGTVQEAEKGGGYGFRRFQKLELKIPETPDAFLRPAKRPEEMSYWQLKRFAREVRREGYNPTRYLVDMNIKLAFPLVSLVMVLIGLPVTLGLKGGGTPLAVCIGIGVCFLYLINLGVARSLGLSGILPPHLAAWSANLIFSLLGVYLLMNLET